MLALETALKKKIPSFQRLAVLGVGSELRSDDSAGLLAAEYLRKSSSQHIKHKKLKVFFGSTAPENLTGEIKKYKPTHLVIVDSAEIKGKPGSVKLIDSSEIGGVSFSSHQLPLKIMADYLAQSIDCQVLVIGIQPKNMDFNYPPSKEVKTSAKRVAASLKKILQNNKPESLVKG